MDIYVFRETRCARSLYELCFRFLFARGDEGDVKWVSAEKSLPNGRTQQLLSVYIMDSSVDMEAQARRIRQANQGHYVIVTVQSMREAFSLVPPAVRPSGFVLEPPEEELLNSLLEEIFRDCSFFEEDGDSFLFQIRSRRYVLPCKSILFFESRNKKLTVRTFSQSFDFYDTMAEVQQRLPADFIRVHKSFLVNRKQISSVDFGNLSLTLSDGSSLLMSRSGKRALKEALAEGRAQA